MLLDVSLITQSDVDWKGVAEVITAFATLLTVVLTYLKNRKASKDEFDVLKEEVGEVKSDQKAFRETYENRQLETDRDILRNLLLQMFNDYPEQVEGILDRAKRYFIELDGDGFVFVEFRKWQAKQLPDSPYPEQLIPVAEKHHYFMKDSINDAFGRDIDDKSE